MEENFENEGNEWSINDVRSVSRGEFFLRHMDHQTRLREELLPDRISEENLVQEKTTGNPSSGIGGSTDDDDDCIILKVVNHRSGRSTLPIQTSLSDVGRGKETKGNKKTGEIAISKVSKGKETKKTLPWGCFLCGRRFRLSKSLGAHMLAMHDTTKGRKN